MGTDFLSVQKLETIEGNRSQVQVEMIILHKIGGGLVKFLTKIVTSWDQDKIEPVLGTEIF